MTTQTKHETSVGVQAVKLSMRMEQSIYRGLERDAKEHGRDVTDHIQRILGAYVIEHKKIDPSDGRRLILFWSLVSRAVSIARQICRDGYFDQHITLRSFQTCMNDIEWAHDYEQLVKDNPYKSGNPNKGAINKEIGFRIREGIGSSTIKDETGKSATIYIKGEIIQSYTPMADFDKASVAAPTLS